MSGFQATQDTRLVADGLHKAASLLGDLEPVNTEAGQIILANAQPPRKSGATAAGMFAAVTPGGLALASRTDYWTYAHWGAPRRHVRANPWLLAATRASTQQVAALYTEHAQDSLAVI